MAYHLEPLGDNLVRVWHFNDQTGEWTFFDLHPAFASFNTIPEMVQNDLYWLKVNIDTTVVLDNLERDLLAGWNLINW